MARDWASRMEEWKGLSEPEQCRIQASILIVVSPSQAYAVEDKYTWVKENALVDNIADIHPNPTNWPEMLKSMEETGSLSYVGDIYPMNCMSETLHNTRFHAGLEEHTRLCPRHAQLHGWEW